MSATEQAAKSSPTSNPVGAAESLTYQSKAVTGFVIGGVFLITGLVLIWLAFVLGPKDRNAMDGMNYVLFSIVPIRLFCWIMAAVMLALGTATVVAAIKAKPALVLQHDSLTLPSGDAIPYSAIKSIQVTGKHKDTLRLELSAAYIAEAARPPASKPPSAWKKRLLRIADQNVTTINAFALGAAPAKVKAEIERRMKS